MINFTIKKPNLYGLYIIILLTTEFYYVDIAEGSARIYHFLTIPLFISLTPWLHKTFKSPVTYPLLFFLIVNFISAFLSTDSSAALTSLLSLTANIAISFTIALLLISGKYKFSALFNNILYTTSILIAISISQVLLYKINGTLLSFSETQSLQIVSGFAPSLKSEANTFAKYLNFIFLLILPSTLSAKDGKKYLKYMLIIVVGMLINFTRSAIAGLVITIIIFCLLSLFLRYVKISATRMIVLTVLITSVAAIIIPLYAYYNEYAAYKIENLFNIDSLQLDQSASFRLYSQDVLIDSFLSSYRTIIIGNGWGQVFYDYGGERWQAGGAEIITAFAYGGFFSGLFYIWYSLSAIFSSFSLVKKLTMHPDLLKYMGLMFALIGSLVTGQINGAMIAPEYWLLYGIAIYTGYQQRHNNNYFKF